MSFFQGKNRNKHALNLVMLSNLPFLLVFCSGVTLAIVVSFLPEICRFLGIVLGFDLPRQLGWTDGLRLSQYDVDGISGPIRLEVKNLGRHYEMTETQVPSILKEDPRDHNVEAIAALDLAKEMISQGKKNKAQKLLHHAMALAPRHPDILNEYGEFLEKTKEDIVTAEHMYCRALILSPGHTRALTNRKRTLPLVDEIDQNTFNRIDQKRKLLFQIPDHDPAMRRMKKESYFRHIYHTTAIEGNTFSLVQTRLLIETQLAVGGKSILEHQEILGMDLALSFVNNSLLHQLGNLAVVDIQELHKRVLGFVDPISAGNFRTKQVFVGDFMPPTADEIPGLVEEFVRWLNSEEALSLHPIELAALVHYRLVYIHPFYDGNGRTSRLLMNVVLMQAGFPPVTIRVEEKHDYYRHLQTANDGDIRPFIRFIAKCTEKTLNEYLWATSDAGSSPYPGLIMETSENERVIAMDTEKDSNDVLHP